MKKFLSVLLTVALICQTFTPVFADTRNTVGNTAEQNLTILEKLSSMVEDELTEEDVLGELQQMGLLDEEGNLKVSESIMVNGTPMTLVQVRALIDTAGTDLTQVVNVDGTQLTLRDLKTMIEIEEELARIRNTYLSGAVPLTDDHKSYLSGFLEQIESEGILLTLPFTGSSTGSAISQAAGILGTEPAINQNARIKVSADKTEFVSSGNLILTFSIVDTSGNTIAGGLPYDVSFSWRLHNGSARADDGLYKVINESGFIDEGTVTITASTQSVQSKINIDMSEGEENDYMRWDGDKIFLIQAYDPGNILFYKDVSESSVRAVDIPITLSRTYEWTKRVERRDASNGTTYGMPLNDTRVPNWINYNNEDKLRYTIQDVFGGINNAKFLYSLYIRMESSNSGNYTMNAKPMLQDMDGKKIDNAEYAIGAGNYSPYGLSAALPVTESGEEGTQLYARFGGTWPGFYAFTESSLTPAGYADVNSDTILIPEWITSIEIIDTDAPQVKSITAPAGTYYSGQIIPITVEFTEPVFALPRKAGGVPDYNYPLGLTVYQGEQGGGWVSPEEDEDTISKFLTFLYKVPDNPNNRLIVSKVEYIQDMSTPFNKTSKWPADDSKTTIEDVEMKIDPFMAFEDLSLTNQPQGGYKVRDTIEVRLDVDETVSLWMEQPDQYDADLKQLRKIYLKAGDAAYPLEMRDEGAYYIASIPAENFAEETAREVNITLYTDGTYNSDTGSFSGGSAVIGMTVKADIAPLVLASGIIFDTSTYPQNNIIYMADAKDIILKASVTPAAADFTDIQWVSSAPSVATISLVDPADTTNARINTVSAGTVRFTATVQNGSYGSVTESTPEFIVSGGGSPALFFPEGNNAFYTKKGEAVNVTWRQNLIGRTPGAQTEFTIEAYQGNYPNPESITGAPVWTGTITDASGCTIPVGVLNTVSSGFAPAYTVKVSAVNPDSHAILSAIGYVIVYPQPAKVNLAPLQSYYITDATDQLDIRWTLSDYVGEGGQFELKILKNQTTLNTGAPGAGGGSYTLNLEDVAADTLRDVYTVSVRAKNASDNSWSSDSFILYVYNRTALKIMTDGQSSDSVTMDNNSYIKNLYQTGGSDGILALDRNIWLKNKLGINYDDYAWGNISDQIKWESADSGTASVNYKQGSLYENIERFSYSTYRPSTEFMLAGNDDGSTVITATHAATGMKDTLNVDVRTLKDKLYIFNFYPKRATTLTYTNGDGDIRTLISNDDGEIAVYEEKGIEGNISLKSGTPADLYLGTLYNNKLISSEGDAGTYELYPVNIFELRPAAKVKLFFKQSDGKPYTGTVTYGGAVYKNGLLCGETLTNSGTSMTIGADGSFALNLDSTQFWTDSSSEVLTGLDKLEFIYEVLADGYYPQLITVNGNINVEDVVRFGESVINLKPAGDADKNKPFIASQAVDYNLSGGRLIDVTNYTGSVGPGNMYPSAGLRTIASWWGLPKVDGYDLKIEDEYGSVIEGQRVKTILYPFAAMSYTQNVTTMNEKSLNLDIGEKKGATAAFYLPDGKLIRHVKSPFTFTNMVGAPDADDKDKGVKNALKDLNESGNLEFDSKFDTGSDEIIGIALNMMSGTSLGGQLISLLITATEDPMIYRGLITMKQGLGETEDIPEPEIGIKGPDAPELSFTPNINDIIDPGTAMDDLEEAMNNAVTHGVDYGISITGYFEVEVRYDEEAGKWIMVVLGGGFDLEGLIGYTWKINQMVGPVPITAEFGLGAQSQLAFRATKPYGNVPVGINAADVNDFFTALRINFYVKAFGGFGFDYSILALKIGIFGQVNMTYNAEFLNRSYLAPPPEGHGRLFGITETLSGQVGIKFVAKLVFISYEFVLASASYALDLSKSGNPELIEEWKAKQNTSMMSGMNLQNSLASYITQYAMANSMQVVDESTGFESRDYLSLYDRTWGSAETGLRGLQSLQLQGTTDIQTNAYPYANPVITRDGKILAYLSDSGTTDLNETRASWAVENNGAYTDQGAIASPQGAALADSKLSLDGTEDFAVAAWERQGVEITAQGSPSAEDISAMFNSTDIFAGVYDGTGWIHTRLTDNLVPDMAPAVAADNGRAIVAWRSATGSDMSSDGLSYDDVNDSILYKIYSNGVWGDTQTLYNGALGNVKAIAASMDDGTAAVAYTVNCGTAQSSEAFGYETFCGVIDSSGNMIGNLRLSNNDAVDENPQIVAADFAAGGGATDENFVLGWSHATTAGAIDIRFAAVDENGVLYDGFADALSSVAGNSRPNITGNFRFAKGEDIDITDLSLLWVEPGTEYDNASTPVNNAGQDSLKAVKFMRDDQGRYYLTGVLDVADMEDYTLIDHFDAFTSGPNQVGAALLTTSYTGPLEDHGNGVYTVGSVSAMKSVSAEFENIAEVKEVYLDYGEIRNDFRLPIQFTVVNRGIDPIDSVTVELSPDNLTKSFSQLNLLPDQAAVLTLNYDVPGAQDAVGGKTGIHDIDYTVTAAFGNNDRTSLTGSLNLDVPDTGISKVEMISDEQGKRIFQAILHNLSDVPLANSSNRKVKISFYRSPEFEELSKVVEREITGADLSLLDQSALTMRFTYSLPPAGIPSGGTRLYGRIWVEEKQSDNSYDEVTEYYQDNNTRSILFPNPIEANNGEPFLVSVIQENGIDATTAHITVKNLSMTPTVNGNVCVQLLDASGRVIETRLLATSAQDLLTLAGEERKTRTVIFSKLGAKVRAEYYTADPNSMDSAISDISLSGISMSFDEQITDYNLTAENLGATTITATAGKLEDTVEIRNSSNNQVLASGTGAASYTLTLSGTQSPANLKIMAVNSATQATSATYNLSIVNADSTGAAVTLNAVTPAYRSTTVTVHAYNLSDFIPVKWQYMINGVFSELLDWKADANQFVLSGTGTYTVSVRLLDRDGYYIDSGAKYIEIIPSGGGTSSDSSGDQIIETDENSLTVTLSVRTANIEGGTAKVSLNEADWNEVIRKCKEAEASGQNSLIELIIDGIQDVNGVTVDITDNMWALMADETDADFLINAGMASIVFDAEAVDAIAGGAGGDISLDIHKADVTTLSEEARLMIGDRPVFDFTLTKGGQEIAGFGGGTAEISIPYTPTAEELANPEAIVIWYIDSNGNIASIPNGHYDAASGTVTFSTAHFSRYAVGYNKVTFTDMNENAWYSNAVGFIAARGITAGTGGGKYSPSARLTRGEFIVMLMKAYGIEPDTDLTDNFTDAGSTYYTNFLAAAKRLGISGGVGNNLFAPGKEITRQELFTLTYNALKIINSLPQGKSGKTLTSFGDAEQVASWAKEAMSYMVETGTVSGSGGMLTPMATTNRAEMAQVLYNLLNE